MLSAKGDKLFYKFHFTNIKKGKWDPQSADEKWSHKTNNSYHNKNRNINKSNKNNSNGKWQIPVHCGCVCVCVRLCLQCRHLHNPTQYLKLFVGAIVALEPRPLHPILVSNK